MRESQTRGRGGGAGFHARACTHTIAPPPHAPTRTSLRLAVDLASVVEHCRCSICRGACEGAGAGASDGGAATPPPAFAAGIVKNARSVSACMHRFCKDCIEAWLRTQM